MNAQQLLEKLGYSSQEVAIYLASLEMGEATVSELSHRTNIPRTTITEAVGHMQKKGLLLPYTKKLRRFWVAQNPEKLLTNLKENEKEFESLLPELVAMRKGSGNKPSVRTFSGVEDIKKIMDDIIDSKHHIAALISWDDWVGFFGSEFIQDFIKRRHSHFLKIRVISPRTTSSEQLRKNKELELRQIRFLPNGIDLKRISNFIYGDKVAIISTNKREPTGVVIDDADVAYGNLLYFENLWQHSSEN